MFNDDSKDNTRDSKITDAHVETPQSVEQTASETQNTQEEQPKLAEIIEFDPNAKPANTLSAQEALDDAIKGLKSAFSDIKTQFVPILEGLKEVSNVIRESTGEAAKNLSEIVSSATETSQETDAQTTDHTDEKEQKTEDPTVTISRETSAAIAESINQFKKRAEGGKLNLGNILSSEFEHYADEKLTDRDYTVDENGKRVVKLDGAFIQAHGDEMIPTLIRGTVGTFLKTLLGDNIMAQVEQAQRGDDEETTTSDASEDATDTAEPEENTTIIEETAEDVTREKKYRIEFDFANAVSDIVKNARIVPNRDIKTPEDEKDLAVSKEVIIETSHIAEDLLNGKSVDTDARMQAAFDRAETQEKRPEEIEAIDDKHRRILELSKQFEEKMASDPNTPNEDKEN